MPQPPETLNHFDSLVQVIRDLRGPDGCPWDKEQSHTTLTPYAIEETFEMVEAIESGNDAHMCEELGDVLFQVVLHAQLAHERGAFDIGQVIDGINRKIVRRHPHVFADVNVQDTNEVLKNWEVIKQNEKKNSPKPKTALDVPPGLPALQRSHKIGEKTKKHGFDWSEPQQVLAQLKAEIAELEEAMGQNDPSHIAHEMGDVLFSAAQLARHLSIEPESNLRSANQRFTSRFEKMLAICGGLESFTNLPPAEKETLWAQAKKTET